MDLIDEYVDYWKDINVDDYRDSLDLIDVKNNTFINLRDNISIDEYKKNIGKDVMLWINNTYGVEGCSATLVGVSEDSIKIDKSGEEYDIKLSDIKEAEFLLDNSVDIELNTVYVANITNVYDKSIKAFIMLEEIDGQADDELYIRYINKDTNELEFTYYPTRLIKDINIIKEI